MAAGERAVQGRPLFLPLMASVATCASLAGLLGALDGGSPIEFVLAFLAGGVIGLLHALLLGVPLVYGLLRRGRFDAMRMSLGGAVIGVLPLGFMSILGGAASSGATGLKGMLGLLVFLSLFGAIGALSAWAYFLAYRWRLRHHVVPERA